MLPKEMKLLIRHSRNDVQVRSWCVSMHKHKIRFLRETAIDLHVGVMALVCGGRTYVQKVSVTKKVSKNINRRKVSNDDGQNMKSVYHSKQNNRISLDNSRLLWDFGSFLVRLLILFRNFLDRRVF